MGMTSKTLHGRINFPTVTEGPFMGIIYGGDVAVTVNYDASKVPATGPHAYMTNKGADGGVSFTAGGLNLNPGMDNSGSMGWPLIQFNEGQLTGVDYYHSFDESNNKYVFRSQGLYWEIVNTSNRDVAASGRISVK